MELPLLPSHTIVQIVGYIATTLTAIASVPQVVKTIKTKDTASVSLLMFLCLTVGFAGWLVYGVLTLAYPMIIGNAIAITFQLIVIAYKIKNIRAGKEPAIQRKKGKENETDLH